MRIVKIILLTGLIFGISGCGPTARADQVSSPALSPVPTLSLQAETPDETAEASIAEVPNDGYYHGAQPVLILMYHYVREMAPADDVIGRGLTVTPATFERHLQQLLAAGYQTVTPQTLRSGTLPPKPVIITIDDGYSDAYSQAFPILQKFGSQAVFYVITNRVGQDGFMSWPQIQEMAAYGMTFGSHTLDHVDLTETALSTERLNGELVKSKQVLDGQLGRPVTDFCYPSGQYNDATIAAVRSAGYLSATTVVGRTAKAGDNWLTLPRVRTEESTDLPKLLK